MLGFASQGADSHPEPMAEKPHRIEVYQELRISLDAASREEACMALGMAGARRGARRDQRQLNGIEAQIAVVNARGKFWADALEWGRLRDLLTPTESGVLGVAANIPHRTPTEKQSAKAIEVLTKLQGEGYAGELDAAVEEKV